MEIVLKNFALRARLQRLGRAIFAGAHGNQVIHEFGLGVAGHVPVGHFEIHGALLHQIEAIEQAPGPTDLHPQAVTLLIRVHPERFQGSALGITAVELQRCGGCHAAESHIAEIVLTVNRYQ